MKPVQTKVNYKPITTYKHLTVIARLEDGENEQFTFSNLSKDQAVQQVTEYLTDDFEQNDLGYADKDCVIHFVGIVVSDSQITYLEP